MNTVTNQQSSRSRVCPESIDPDAVNPQRPEFQCPRCAETELTLTVVFSGTATCRFRSDQSTEILEAEEMDSEIPRLGKCTCRRCGWTGLARDAMSKFRRASEAAATLSELELQQLIRNLGSTHLSPRLRDQLNLLVDELVAYRRQQH